MNIQVTKMKKCIKALYLHVKNLKVQYNKIKSCYIVMNKMTFENFKMTTYFK